MISLLPPKCRRQLLTALASPSAVVARGSAIARLAGMNVKRHSDQFEERVAMWVFEEDFEGQKLTEVINSTHENKKYLPDVKLPENVVAVPDLVEAVKGATAIVFVMPHQVRELGTCELERAGLTGRPADCLYSCAASSSSASSCSSSRVRFPRESRPSQPLRLVASSAVKS